MTLPNGPAGLASQGLEWAMSAFLPGTISGAPTRTRTNVEAYLKEDMQGNSGWLGASDIAFGGLLGTGLDLVTNIIYTVVNKLFGFVTGGVFDLDDLWDFISGLPLIGSLIPGLDASKIISGEFPMAMVTGLIDLAGDVGEIVGNIVSTITSGVSTTLGGLASWVANVPTLISGVLNPIVVPLIDASKIISGTFNNSFIPGLLGLFNGLWRGFTGGGAGAPPGEDDDGYQADLGDVENVTTGSSQTVAGISAAVARMQAQLADLDPLTTLVEEPWEYSGAVDSGRWNISFRGPGLGGPEVDGHQAYWVPAGAAEREAFMVYVGPDADNVNDRMQTKIVLGDYITPATTNQGFVGILAHVKDAGVGVLPTEYLILWLGRTMWRLDIQNGATTTNISGGWVNLSATPGPGSIITLSNVGTASARTWVVSINGQTWTCVDAGSALAMGVNNRKRGQFMRGGATVAYFITYATACGNIAHWASQNAA